MINIFNSRIFAHSSVVHWIVFGVFATISVFGAMIISGHMDGDCLSSLLNSEDCPGGTMAALDHHLTLPHLFALVILTAFLATLVLFAVFALRWFKSSSPPLRGNFHAERREDVYPNDLLRLNFWLSRLLNAPNLF
ncbi:MAG: hypothetical protein A3H57_03140 [Candidatus Taylorbacteria bacterium RIFCSPLOWO2_02_FULL_43_11]|uniref:Uncharacterized protein n=1 Tax=Candidatus Taylorbacteria bacterium RIFCSPHIGHO2_02_FULL_43_32b TaxID=1802306 RepID=A0A1G2MLH3_9BACT|nr:MAG: hypothetical protein A2743_03235 [Candidatus Taylorbacteria bacterium RIFCSPHIGHO2_01_FULL_43_47]OHA24760.1 MAG: hypothetical protein A3C72_00800 [Candidatus Taylorbacteria bacterium RIFCSPHIGHO2_02_FULL_43_32b]OHA31686.1 MAG: hypothetical protein A3B08_00145 [Candidatus Taylorbacteria bacterium RIFCSPLOWO2_01_FULL_43_44]OHA35399.1 MAG: hypothetical protein A3H57_03140 [Candidatus Taylorbacteria bacterium RIFCSPLOWO2_02_FULL_43_11]